METKSMLLISSFWNGMPTFRMIPTTLDCPYTEVIFINGVQKGMSVIGKTFYDKLQLVPKLDEKGMQIPQRINGQDGFVMQRITLQTPNEYQLLFKEEWIEFIKLFASNEATFDYLKFIEMDFTPKADDGLGLVDKDGKKLRVEKGGASEEKKKKEVN